MRRLTEDEKKQGSQNVYNIDDAITVCVQEARVCFLVCGPGVSAGQWGVGVYEEKGQKTDGLSDVEIAALVADSGSLEVSRGRRDRQGLIGGDGTQRRRFAAGPLDEKLINRVLHSRAEVCRELRLAEIGQSSWMLVE